MREEKIDLAKKVRSMLKNHHVSVFLVKGDSKALRIEDDFDSYILKIEKDKK